MNWGGYAIFGAGFVLGILCRERLEWTNKRRQPRPAPQAQLVTPQVLEIAFAITDQVKEIDKILVLSIMKDGRGASMDNGLTTTEAKAMTASFSSWVDQCIGREMERDQ